MLKKKKSKVTKIVTTILTLALVLSFVFGSTIVNAATNSVEAFFATYDTFINGEKIDKNNVLVYNSETYVKVPVLQNFGVNRNWDEANRIASFQIQNPVVEQTEMSITQARVLQEYSVRFYEGSVDKKNFRGNGTKVSKDTIVSTDWIRYDNQGNLVTTDFKKLIAVDNNNNEIKLKNKPIATGVQGGKKFILVQTTGAIFPKWAKVATVAPVANDVLVVCGSVMQTPNYISVDMACPQAYEDYDLFDSGMSEFLRTQNNSNYSTRGSGIYNIKGELVSITTGKDYGRGYLLGTTLQDLSKFVGFESSEN